MDKRHVKLPAVFHRLSDDIVKWNTKTAIQRTTGTGFATERMRTNKRNEDILKTLSFSQSNLGKAILYGNKSHQRHLDMKLMEIESQKIRRMRNMEWTQLREFRRLAKEGIARYHNKEGGSGKGTNHHDKLTLPVITRGRHFNSEVDRKSESQSKSGSQMLKLPQTNIRPPAR